MIGKKLSGRSAGGGDIATGQPKLIFIAYFNMPKPTDKNIKEVYNSIAEGFYNLRQHPITPEVTKLSETWKPGKLLDIGCGIGNSILPFSRKGFECTGIDISSKMIGQAGRYRTKNNADFDFQVSSVLNLPFKESSFDYIIAIAVLHHLDSEEKRLKALEETKRILKPKGKIFLTVWNKENPSKKDAYIPWISKGKKYGRYYHFFEKEELDNLLQKAGFKKIKIFEDEKKKNLCVLVSNH